MLLKRISMSVIIFITVCSIICPSLSYAQTNPVYVATTGSDITGNGTSSNPYATINKGAAEASDGDTVVVADGVYVLSEEIKVENKRIFVRSQNGYETCIIDAAGNNGFYLRITDYVSNTALMLTGLTIRNAATAVYACEATNANIKVSNIKDSSNGVYCEIGGGGASCTGSIFSGNGHAVIIDGDGGCEITECTFSGNGEGVGIYSSSFFGIRSSYFDDNDEPINIGWYCTGTISNNLLHHNSRGIAAFAAMDIAIYFNTISENTGPAILIDGMQGDIRAYNNVLWNTASDHEISIVESFEYSGDIDIAFNAVANGLAAIDQQDPDATVNWLTGNISSNPLFADIAGDDYQLLDYSPCIGAGTGTLPTWPAVVTDIVGTPRGTPPDMGAYENALDSPVQMNIHVATTGSDITGTGTPSNPYATINKGAMEASDDDTVIVADGVYEPIEPILIHDKMIVIRSASGYGSCIIDGNGINVGGSGQDESQAYLTMQGVTITNTGTAVYVNGQSKIVLRDSKITNCGQGIWGDVPFSGIDCYNSVFINAGIAITTSEEQGDIHGNSIINCITGINSGMNSGLDIRNNVIQNNSGYGISMGHFSTATIINNLIASNTVGIYLTELLSEDYHSILRFNTITDNGTGILSNDHSYILDSCILWNDQDGNEIEATEYGWIDNREISITHCDIRDGQGRIMITGANTTLQWGDGNISSDPQFVDPPESCKLQDSSPCIGAGNADGAPMTDIRGITRGTPPDMGAYENALDVPVSMIIYVATTGNDGTGNGTFMMPFKTIQKGIDTANESDTVVVLDGVYTGPGNVNLNYRGKAITVKSQNGPNDCIIDCESTPGTIGFYFDEHETNSSVVDGFTIRRGSFEIAGRGTGGAIDCYDASPTIMNNVICDNVSHEGGGIRCYNSSPIIVNNLIYNNLAGSWGGGISCESFSSPVLMNNTIVGNWPDGVTSIISSNTTIINSVVWNNSGNNEVMGDATVTISYSNIKGGQAGVHMFGGTLNWLSGNISDDPQFVDPASDNYQLLDFSPCIGAGTAIGAPLTDIVGIPRGIPPDMGAYENALDVPINGLVDMWVAADIGGYVHPYIYRWDGCEYVPVHFSEDGTFEGTMLDPWEGGWIILNNQNMNFGAIDILIPYLTDDIPPFTVEANQHYLFSAPVDGGETDLNASEIGQQLGDGTYEQAWRIGKWKWDIEGYHNYNGPNPVFDELMSLLPGKGFWLQQITDEPITLEIEGTGPAPTYNNYYEIRLPKNNLDVKHTYHMIGNPYGKPTLWGGWKVRVPSTDLAPTAKVAYDPEHIEQWYVGLKLIASDGTARDTYNRAGVVTSGDPDLLRAFDLEPVGEYVRLTVSDPTSQQSELIAYDYRPDGLAEYTWQISMTTNYESIDAYFTLDNIIDVPDGYRLVLTDDSIDKSFEIAEDYSIPVILHDGAVQTFTLTASTSPVIVDEIELPTAFGIKSTMPNPFNSVTTIQYSLTEHADVNVNVYNVNGQLVDTLVDMRMNPGVYSVVWNAKAHASGMYFIALEAGIQHDAEKVMLMK